MPPSKPKLRRPTTEPDVRGALARDGESLHGRRNGWRDDHRDHHQRGAERGRATSRSGASTSSRTARVMKTGLRDGGRQARRCRDGLQGPGASVPRGHRLRHVADRLRRGMPFDALHRQADEGAHADAGHRAREPRLSRQGFRPDRRLQRHAGEPARGAGAVCAWRRRGRRRRGNRRADRGAGAGAARGHRGDREAPARCWASIRRRCVGARGLRDQGPADAVEAVYTSDEAKRRFEIMARQVFIRFKALLMEPSAFAYAERHDNIEAIYKKLTETARHRRRDRAAQGTAPDRQRGHPRAGAGRGPGRGLTFDLSQIDLEKLRDEFAKKVRRKARGPAGHPRRSSSRSSPQMLARNPMRMDYYRKYEEIIADYNREKDRTTIEETFARLVELANSLDAEQQRAAAEGLSEDELALFDLLLKESIGKADRERVKQASRALLASLRDLLRPMHDWTQNTATQAEVQVFILDNLWQSLPRPPFRTRRPRRSRVVCMTTSGSGAPAGVTGRGGVGRRSRCARRAHGWVLPSSFGCS